MDSNTKQRETNVVEMNENNEKSVETQQMADQSQSSSTPSTTPSTTPSSTSWWNSWVQKSSDAFESIKKDLNELKETVQNDTVGVVTNTAGVVTNTMATTATYVTQTMRDTITGISNTMAPDLDQTSDQTPQTDETSDSHESRDSNVEDSSDERTAIDGKPSDDWALNLTHRAKHRLNELMGSIANAFVMNRDYCEDEDQMYVMSGDKLVAIDRWQQMLAEVQTDPKTYCHEPKGAPEDYESWLMTFNLIDYRTQMDHLLETVPQMKDFYTQLVPNSLSDVEFWHRFYYRVHQLRECEKNKIDNKSNDSKDTTEESINWNQNKKTVEIKLLEEKSSSFENQQMKAELISIASTECSDIQSLNDMTSSPDSSDTQKSETGSDGWEKTDIVVSDEDIKDWVKYE